MAWPAESLHIKCNDDAATTVVVDSSVNATNGTLVGGDNTDAKSVVGKINDALSLNGTDDYIDFGNILNLEGNYSLALWLKTADVGIIISKVASVAGSYWYAYANPSGKFNVRLDGSTADADAASTASINGDVFNHLVFTWDGTTLRLYVNNTADGTSAPGAALGTVSNAGGLFVARWNPADSGGLYLTGTWDDIRIYKGSVLDTDMISALYNSGNGTEATLASLEPSGFTPRLTLLGVG